MDIGLSRSTLYLLLLLDVPKFLLYSYTIDSESSEYFDYINGTNLSLTSHIDWNDDRGKGTAQIIKK